MTKNKYLAKSCGIEITAQNNQVFLQGSVPAASISWQVGPFFFPLLLSSFAKPTNQTNSMQGDIRWHLPLTFPLPMDPCLHLHTITQGEQIQGVPNLSQKLTTLSAICLVAFLSDPGITWGPIFGSRCHYKTFL